MKAGDEKEKEQEEEDKERNVQMLKRSTKKR